MKTELEWIKIIKVLKNIIKGEAKKAILPLRLNLSNVSLQMVSQRMVKQTTYNWLNLFNLSIRF